MLSSCMKEVSPATSDLGLWRIVPDGKGAFWLVTAATHRIPDKMIYIASWGWSEYSFNSDPQTKFNIILSG